jgi:hypothetical protein
LARNWDFQEARESSSSTINLGCGNLAVSPGTNGADFDDLNRDLRLSVRCIKTRTPISFNGLTYKMITSSKTGRVWLDRNLGATQVATSFDDSAAYGDLYQWGRAKDGHINNIFL